MSGVQRFLYGGNNAVRLADLSGPVKPITDAVVQKPIARQGSTSGKITGTFTGAEEAIYELEVVDLNADVALVTAPVFSGTGNGSMEDIAATGLSPREITVALADLGQVLTASSTELQGVRVVQKTPGANGNKFVLRVDRSGLTFTPQSYTLLKNLEVGNSAVTGPEFDWETVTINADGSVPANAKRIAFGEDINNIYVQYKKVVKNKTTYVFEPPIEANYPYKTQIKFVTGTYSVSLWEDVAGTWTLRETYAGIVTLFDLLDAIKTTSAYIQVQGAVANDRNTNGQALLELGLNTTARFITNAGVGTSWATGFIDITIEAGAPTELVEATCIAAKSTESAGASMGNELWEVRGSVSGLIRTNVKTGDLVSTANYSFRIPQKLPEGYTNIPRGDFAIKEIQYNYKRRTGSDETGYVPKEPPICLDSPTLGLNAREMLITLKYVKRPVADNCACTEDNNVALSPICLGVVTETEGGSMAYSASTVTRLVSLYDWFADTVRDNSEYFNSSPSGGGVDQGPYVEQDPFISQPTNNPVFTNKANFAYVSMFDMIKRFEETLAEVDKLGAGALRTAAEDAWDDAVVEMQADVDTHLTGAGTAPTTGSMETYEAGEALAQGDAVGVFETTPGTYEVRKAAPGAVKYGFVKAAFILGADADVYFYGVNDWIVSAGTAAVGGPVSGWTWFPSADNPGEWVNHQAGSATGGDAAYLTQFSIIYVDANSGARAVGAPTGANTWGYALLADRYISRLKWVLISGGISPLGKGNASDNVGGDGCWQDNGGDYWWEVTAGDEVYAPMFTGIPYYSAKKYPGGVQLGGMTTPSEGYYSTMEFGFILDVPCKQNLVVGDIVLLRIGNAGATSTYQKGDKLSLGIVAGRDITFFGGKDGDNVQTWYVSDSVDGARAPYLLDTDAPTPYNTAGLDFEISQGPIPFVKGDQFQFAIEGGNFRWRKLVGGVAGAWSADLDVVKTPIALDSGMSLQWSIGTSPALFVGDTYRFVALQPYAISNIIKPDFDMWQWGDESPAVGIIELDADTPIEAIGIAFHTIPEGATIEVEGSADGITWDWLEEITWQKDIIGKLMPPDLTATFLRLTITNGEEGGIGWLYAGPALAFTHSAHVKVNREYKVKRSDGVNPSSIFKGRGVGGEVQWPEGHLTEDDYYPMLAMVDWLKENDDEAFMFFPQETRQTEVILATVESDALAFNDVYNFQPNAGKERRLSCTIPLRGVALM